MTTFLPGFLLMAAFYLAIVCWLAALVLGLIMVTRRSVTSPDLASSGLRRHAHWVTTIACLVATPCLLAALGLAFLGLGSDAVVTAPLIALALGLLLADLAFAIGESSWPTPAAAVRLAPLTRRGLIALLPRWRVWLVSGGLMAALATFALTGLDRSLNWPAGVTWFVAIARPEHGFTPTVHAYPDAAEPWGLILLAAACLVTGGAALWVGLVRVVRRPAIGGLSPELDTQMRRLSAHRVVRTTSGFAGLALLLGAENLALPLIEDARRAGDAVLLGGTADAGTDLVFTFPAIAVMAGCVGLAIVLFVAACLPPRPPIDFHADR